MAPNKQAKSSTNSALSFALPFIYRIFFLAIEPISALVGAYYAHFRQDDYLKLTDVASAPRTIPLGTAISLSQLANLYFFFALNEALVLRSTADLRIYWDFSRWNAIDWGNVPFVYLGASLRVAFLANVGLGSRKRKPQKST